MKHRKLLAILLSLSLLLSLLPATALAAVGPNWNDECRGNPKGDGYGKHNWVKEWEDPTGCTTPMYVGYTCTYCGASVTRETKAPGHKWGSWKTTKEATCTRNGVETRKCKVCGEKQTRETDKAAHSWGKWQITKEPTCAAAGERQRTCQVCGRTQTDAAEKLPHTWGEWRVSLEPTDFSAGVHAHTCQVCGAEETQEFDPDPTYRRGDRGDGVKGLQEALNAAGYDCGAADGIFGGKTESAVKGIETAHGVEADGVAWPGVQKWLGMVSAKGPDAADTFFMDGPFIRLNVVKHPIVDAEEWKDIPEEDRLVPVDMELINNGSVPLRLNSIVATDFWPYRCRISDEAWMSGTLEPGGHYPFTAEVFVDVDFGKDNIWGGSKLAAECVVPETGETVTAEDRAAYYFLEYKDFVLLDFEHTVGLQVHKGDLVRVKGQVNNGGTAGQHQLKLTLDPEYEETDQLVDISDPAMLDALPVGGAFTFYYQFTVTEADESSQKAERIVHLTTAENANVTSKFILDVVPDAEAAEGGLVLEVELASEKQLSYKDGDLVTFDWKLTNNTSEDLTLDAVIADPTLDGDGWMDVCASPLHLSANGGSISDAYTLKLDGFWRPDAFGPYEIGFIASGSGETGQTQSNPVTFTLPANDADLVHWLNLEVVQTSPGQESYGEGDQITYHWTLTNDGPVDCKLSNVYYSCAESIGEVYLEGEILKANAANQLSDTVTLGVGEDWREADGLLHVDFFARAVPIPAPADDTEFASNAVEFKYPAADVDYHEEYPDLELVVTPKTEATAFAVGDTITFRVALYDNIDVDMTDPAIFAYGGDGNVYDSYGESVLEGTDFIEFESQYTFTEADAANSPIKLFWRGAAFGPDKMRFEAEDVELTYTVLPEGALPAGEPGPALSIWVTPQSGITDREVGDEVNFFIHVLNHGDADVPAACIRAYDGSGSLRKEFKDIPIAAGDSADEVDSYTFVDKDAELGDITLVWQVYTSDADAEPAGADAVDYTVYKAGGLPQLDLIITQTSPVKPWYEPDEVITFHWQVADSGTEDCELEEISVATPDDQGEAIFSGSLPLQAKYGNSQSGDGQITLYDEWVDDTSGHWDVYFRAEGTRADGGWIRSQDVRFSFPHAGDDPVDETTEDLQLRVLPKSSINVVHVGETAEFDVELYNGSSDTLYDLLVQAYDGQGGAREQYSGAECPMDTALRDADKYTFTEADVGTITLRWTGQARDASGAPVEALPVELTYEVLPEFDWTPPSERPNYDITKSVVGGEDQVFHLNDVIDFEIAIRNRTFDDIIGADLYDYPNGAAEGMAMLNGFTISGGETFTWHFYYTVTQEDVDRGYVTNYARLFIPTDNTPGDSNTVRVSVEAGEPGGVSVVKKVVGAPMDPAGYQKDEVVHYEITVTNDTDAALTDVAIYDPLKGGNEDMVVDLFPEVASGETVTGRFDYTVTGDDVIRGEIVNTASVVWYEDGEPLDRSTNTVTVDTWGQDDAPAISVIKRIVDEKAEGYLLSDTILFEIDVTNYTGELIPELPVYDYLNGDIEGVLIGTLYDVEPGVPYTVPFAYTVTTGDVEAGKVTNQAAARLALSTNLPMMEFPSNTVEAKILQTRPTPAPVPEDEPTPIVTKSIANLPERGFYLEGEQIEFSIVVENPTDDAYFYDIEVFDPLKQGEDKSLGGVYVMGPHDQSEYTLFYTVTGLDVWEADYTYVPNQAALDYKTADGKAHTMLSNIVEAPTGKIVSDEVARAEVAKKEISKPANKKYYVEGEKIVYEITVTNTGNVKLDEIDTFDVLEAGTGWIASEMDVAPGETFTYTFTYTVTANDANVIHKVVNRARVEWNIGGNGSFGWSDPVVSPCGAPEPVLTPGPGSTPEPAEADCCVRRLTGLGDGLARYSLDYCHEHKPIADEVAALVAAAQTKEEELDAWQQATRRWTEAVNAEYDGLLANASEVEKPIIISERTLFFLQLSFRRDALTLRHPDDPVLVEKLISEQLMNKTADFCYELSTAPAARVDSRVQEGIPRLEPLDAPELCQRDVEATETGARYTEDLCTAHRVSEAAQTELLGKARPEELADAWRRIAQLWRIELDALTNARYLAADAQGREIIAADRLTFGKWLTERENLLNLMYPGHPEIVNEVLAQTIRARVLDLCGGGH